MSTASVTPEPPPFRNVSDWELSAQWITLCIRWFGLIVGYLVVNVLGPPDTRPWLNGILTVGAVYALLDLIWHWRGAVFLHRAPLFVSLMEAIFIGLLCHFDRGLESPFRFYYFLSLLVCAIRYSPAVTYSTFAMHAVSCCLLALTLGLELRGGVASLVLLLVFMGWVTWASTALSTLLRSTGQQLSALNRDLEARIQERTQALRESQALLLQREKQAAFGLLAAGIAHEVGNPLTAISSLVQIMNRKDLDSKMQERLRLVDEQLQRIQRTLGELVQFSRPGTPDIQSVDLEEVIENALNIAKYYKRKKGKTIVTEFATGLPKTRAVRDQLLQVFLNLILNALDATDEGQTIEIRTEAQDCAICVTISDNGCGIPVQDQEHLFEPYFTTKKTGTGLGLFVCRNILESLGGKIELTESSPGRTTFQVCVVPKAGPLAPVAST